MRLQRQTILVLAFATWPMLAPAAPTIPNTFTPGTNISASQVNQNFSSLAAQMPGARNVRSEWGQVPGSANAIQSVTITPPAAGQALVFASGSFNVFHTQGNTLSYCVQVSTTAGDTSGCPPGSGRYFAVRSSWAATISSTDANGFGVGYSIVALFPVAAGSAQTFYLNGYSTATGTDTVWLFQPSLTVLFVPNTL
jgi:hypothetical protein